MDHRELVTSDHREYDAEHALLEKDLRDGETIRGVSDDSGLYVRPYFPSPEDLQ